MVNHISAVVQHFRVRSHLCDISHLGDNNQSVTVLTVIQGTLLCLGCFKRGCE